MIKFWKAGILLLIFVAVGQIVGAQQLYRTSQFAINPFLVNPAKVGTQYESPILASYRTQWAGFDSAPKTYTLSGHTGLTGGIGIGGILYSDNTGGAIEKTGLEIATAYKFDVNRKNQLSLGLGFNVNQFSFDNSILEVLDQEDFVLNGFVPETTLSFDASLGMMMYGQDYYYGLAIYNLMQNNLQVETQEILEQFNENIRHFNLTGGFDYAITNRWKLRSAALMKFTAITPVQLDVAARAEWNEMFNAGLVFRALDAIVFTVGTTYKSVLFNYSYDVTTSNASTFSPHSHEVTLGYIIPRASTGFKTRSFKPTRRR